MFRLFFCPGLRHTGVMNKDTVFAALDLGSNSFHLLVTEAGDGHWRVLDKLKHTVRLAEGLQAGGTLSGKVRQRALESLRQMAGRLAGVLPENTRIVGTRALRAASKDRDFFRQAEAILGVPVEVVSGREEARLLYHGVIHSLPPLKKNRLVMDIGGGSTELIVGRGPEIHKRESLHMGCVSFTRRFFAGADSPEKFKKAWQSAVLEARVLLRPHRHAFVQKGWKQAVGASGTFRAVGKVLAANGWVESGISREALDKLVGELMDHGPALLHRLAGLSSQRAPVFPGGLAIVQGLFDSLPIDQVTLAAGALREGVILDLSGRALDKDVRESSVSGLAGRFGVDEAQVRRVQSVVDALLGELNRQSDARDLRPVRIRVFIATVPMCWRMPICQGFRAKNRPGWRFWSAHKKALLQRHRAVASRTT